VIEASVMIGFFEYGFSRMVFNPIECYDEHKIKNLYWKWYV